MPSPLRWLDRYWDSHSAAIETVGHLVFGISVAVLVVTTWVNATFWWALIPAVVGLLVAEWD
jgi:aconitase A